MDTGQCGRCAGCGRIANDEEGTPWKYWEELPVKSAVAVIIGVVHPLPCPACGGTGSTLSDDVRTAIRVLHDHDMREEADKLLERAT